jgi:hypothetical protein
VTLVRARAYLSPAGPDQLVLLSLGSIFFCFIPILDLDLVELSFALVDLPQWRWWIRVGIEVLINPTGFGGASTSTVLAGV